MAAVPRDPGSSAPGSEPVYDNAGGLLMVGRTPTRTPTSSGTYTGNIALPRDQPRDASGAFMLSAEQQAAMERAQVRAAQQRVERAGLEPDAIDPLLEYFRAHGRFPDLSLVGGAGGPGGAGGADGGAAPTFQAAGFSPGMLVALLGGFAVLALLFGKRVR